MNFPSPASTRRPRPLSAGIGWSASYPEWLLGAVAILATLAMLHIRLMNDVVWQFWIARQLLGGARLYADIWEINPPLWFWSAVPVEWLAERLGIGWSSLLVVLVVPLGAGSAWLVGWLMAAPRHGERLVLLLLVFAMTTLVPMLGLGQREQLALVTGLPYAALIARRSTGQSTPVALAAMIGGLGAYGFALKHYFVLVPLALELWLALRQRRNYRPWRPEVLAVIGLAVAYAVAVLVFAPAFLTVIVPMVAVAYYSFVPSLLFLLVKPYTLFWALAGLYLLLIRDEPCRPVSPNTSAFVPVLLITAGGFMMSYFIQRRGWDYHSIPATGVLAIAVGLEMTRLKRKLPLAFGAVLLIWLACAVYPPAGNRFGYDPYLDRVAPGEAVFVAATDAGSIWPAPDRRHLRWVSRAYALWMMPAIAKAQAHAPISPKLRALAAKVQVATSQDIRCNPPALIVMERIPGDNGGESSFTFRDYLFADQPLRQFVAAHYAPLPPTPRSIAYARQGPVAPLADPACRKIR